MEKNFYEVGYYYEIIVNQVTNGLNKIVGNRKKLSYYYVFVLNNQVYKTSLD